jgi:predicted RNA-binding Zn-ribbon protein involved in translation (DUF1610 family)
VTRVLGIMAAVLLGQPAGEPVPAAEVFRDRLEALSPADAAPYYHLGEEVAERAASAEDWRLAVELFVLAYELDRSRAEGATWVSSSACVALASCVRVEENRRWLLALAQVMDPRRATPEWLARPSPPTQDSSAYQAATAIGLIRSGEGVRARQLLGKPEVRGLIERSDRLLIRMGVGGGASAIIREAERWPCPECAGQRVVRRGRPEAVEYRACPNCDGNPGPRLSDADVMAQLRFEAWLLQGRQRSWAAQVATDGGAPLLDPDPAGVSASFVVDPRLCYWRQGRWTGTPDGRMPPPPEAHDPAPEDKPSPAGSSGE